MSEKTKQVDPCLLCTVLREDCDTSRRCATCQKHDVRCRRKTGMICVRCRQESLTCDEMRPCNPCLETKERCSLGGYSESARRCVECVLRRKKCSGEIPCEECIVRTRFCYRRTEFAGRQICSSCRAQQQGCDGSSYGCQACRDQSLDCSLTMHRPEQVRAAIEHKQVNGRVMEAVASK